MPLTMPARRAARIIWRSVDCFLTTRADVGALAWTIAGEQVDDATIVAVTARSRTPAPLFAVRGENRPTDIPLASDPLTGRPSTDSAVKHLTALASHSAGLFVRQLHSNSGPSAGTRFIVWCGV